MIKLDKSCFEIDKKAKFDIKEIMKADHMRLSTKKSKYKAHLKDGI